MNSEMNLLDSASSFSAASSSVMMFRDQPHKSLASRTFWPPRPIACARFSSVTAMSIAWVSSSKTIEATSAGAIALMVNWAGLSSQSTISIRSPANSPETACTLDPRMPTQAPTGSIRPSFVFTAIFALDPGSRAAPKIWITSSDISGTSTLNNSTNMDRAVRDKINCGPRLSGRISTSMARKRSPIRNISLGIKCSRVRIPSALFPRSTITLSRPNFLTVPLTNSLTRDS